MTESTSIDYVMNEEVAKKTIKASVFTDLFSIPKYACQLYHVFHPEENNVTDNDIRNINIRNILVNGPYNDLGFIVLERAIFLMEAQSTWSRHILLRECSYLIQTFIEIMTENEINIYGDKEFKLPIPEMYVLYTGDKKIYLKK